MCYCYLLGLNVGLPFDWPDSLQALGSCREWSIGILLCTSHPCVSNAIHLLLYVHYQPTLTGQTTLQMAFPENHVNKSISDAY